MQHPAYQFLRRPLVGNSVNREHKRRASWTGYNRLIARLAPARSPAPCPAWRGNEARGRVAFEKYMDVLTPEDFATQAQGWLEMGVRLIGGCCGIGPEHIRLLKERLL